jgi:hypothetical protein
MRVPDEALFFGRRGVFCPRSVPAKQVFVSRSATSSFPTQAALRMRFTRLLTIVAGGLLAMNNSCKKEDDNVPCPGPITVETTQVPGLKAHITEPIPNVGQSNQYIVNSIGEYRELFDCAPPPMVNFMTHTLLAGKTKTATGSRVLTQQVVQTCTGYTYTVKLEPAAGQKAASVVYYVVVPKIQPTAKVDFEVQLPALDTRALSLAPEQ